MSGRWDFAGRVVGPYRLVRRLGGGGMGDVFLGHDDRLDRPVAIKHVDDELATDEDHARLRREAWAVARLSHPAIVTIFDLVIDDDGEWLVMEHVDGVSLRRQLKRHGRPPRGQALRWTTRIAEALDAAHEREIVHRDLKLDNVMVSHDGHLKVLDFGLAKPLGLLKGPETRVTGTGKILGTVTSMAPEQAEGVPVDHRADLFSLGVVLYELITGVMPFTGRYPFEVIQKLVTTPHAPVTDHDPTIPSWLAALVDALLAKDPEERPESAAIVAETLRSSPALIEPRIECESCRRRRAAEAARRRQVERSLATALPGERLREARRLAKAG